MATTAQNLPPEIKSRIANSCSTRTLTSLALIDKTFKFEAERVLYSTVAVVANQCPSLFETLASNRQKADLVRFLTVEARHFRPDSKLNQPAAQALVSALPILTSLTDLRVRFRLEGEASCTNELNDILRACHFNLHTLFCNEWLDLPEIVKKQSQLKFLGVYGEGEGEKIPQLLNQLRLEDISLPITFYLEFEGNILEHNCISLFPTFLPPGPDWAICQVLKSSVIDRDRGTSMPLACARISDVSFFFETLENVNFVARCILDMIECFPNVALLRLRSKQPFILEMAKIKQIISPVHCLSELEILPWYRHENWDHEYYNIHIEAKLQCVEEWSGVCHDLCSVSFFDGSYMMKSEGGWVVHIA